MAKQSSSGKASSNPAALNQAASAEPEPQRLRQNNPPPNCPVHGVQCVSNRSEPYFTRYYCPEKGCSYSEKVPKPMLAQTVRRERQEEDFSAR